MTVLAPRIGVPGALLSEARRIATEVARPHANAVDAAARVPSESIAALREAGLLGVMVPRAQGGGGAGIREVAATCFELGQACASSAMVFAMHQIQVACLARHSEGGFHDAMLRRVATEGLLLASATTEGTFGGDVRQSDCAVADADGVVTVEKLGCVISYADAAGGVLVTARRTPESPPSDQVLLAAERGQLELEPRGAWDTLGMRGTDSRSYRLRARCDAGQVLPAGYAVISGETMLPVSHIVWSALWLGIATDACARGRLALRDRARRAPGRTPPGAGRLAEALGVLQSARGTLGDAVARYEAALAEPDRLGSISFGLAMNTLKLSCSVAAGQVVGLAMQSIGLGGYRNDTPYSVGRHIRDVQSATLMIGNDRIAANNSGLMTAYRGEEPLFP